MYRVEVKNGRHNYSVGFQEIQDWNWMAIRRHTCTTSYTDLP